MSDADIKPPGVKRSIFAWCLYDWANTAFATVIVTFVFSVYFTRGMIDDETRGSTLWSYAIALSGVFVALLGPVLGAVADHSGRRKSWIFWLSLMCIGPCAMLYYAQPVASNANIIYTLACVVIANLGYELAGVFYNAMLPHIAPRRMLGRISGWAWGFGYLGGLAALSIALVGLVGVGKMDPLFHITGMDSKNLRAAGPFTAIWFLIFMMPMMLWTHDVERSEMSIGASIRAGLGQLKHTLKDLKNHDNLLQFLIASAVYRDGFNTLFAVGGIYAAGVYGMNFIEILYFAIGLNVTAGIGAFAFAGLDDRIGSRRTALISLSGLVATGIAVLMATDKNTFMELALLLGIFIGPVQAASRTLAGRLAPPGMINQTYGLYAFTGKSAAFIGPLAYAAATHHYGSQQAGMFTILMFWIIGLGLLTLVKEGRDV